MTYSKLYGLYQRQNTGSRLFTEVKLCWTALITGSVTIWEISRAVLLSKSGWRCGHQSRLYYKCSRWPEFQLDFEGFRWVLSSVSPLTKKLIHCIT